MGVSHQAQVMIETYKEHTNDDSEIILYSTSHKSSSSNYRDKDEEGSSDNQRSIDYEDGARSS